MALVAEAVEATQAEDSLEDVLVHYNTMEHARCLIWANGWQWAIDPYRIPFDRPLKALEMRRCSNHRPGKPMRDTVEQIAPKHYVNDNQTVPGWEDVEMVEWARLNEPPAGVQNSIEPYEEQCAVPGDYPGFQFLGERDVAGQKYFVYRVLPEAKYPDVDASGGRDKEPPVPPTANATAEPEPEDGNSRVVRFLRELYGSDPSPLRSYLTPCDVFLMMVKFSRPDATHGLDVTHYQGKWARAVEGQIRNGGDPSSVYFWEKARAAYEEYGGGMLPGVGRVARPEDYRQSGEIPTEISTESEAYQQAAMQAAYTVESGEADNQSPDIVLADEVWKVAEAMRDKAIEKASERSSLSGEAAIYAREFRACVELVADLVERERTTKAGISPNRDSDDIGDIYW